MRKSFASLANATASKLATGSFDHKFSLPVESVEQFSGEIGEVKMQVDRLKRDASGNLYDVLVLARVEGEIPRVTEILRPESASPKSSTPDQIKIGLGCVHEGFRIRGPIQRLGNADAQSIKSSGHVIIGCDQIFSRTDLRRKGRRRLGKAIDSFLDLQPGNLIVHLSHGIGRFRGLEMLDKDGQLTEHLELEFLRRH